MFLKLEKEMGNMRKSIFFSVFLAAGIGILSLFLLMPSFNSMQPVDASHYENIKPVEAENMLNSSDNVVFVDVRTDGEYRSGHIPTAVHHPLLKLKDEAYIKSSFKFSKNKKIILYCRTASRSQVASEILENYGYNKIYNLIGGIEGWKESGYKTVETFSS